MSEAVSRVLLFYAKTKASGDIFPFHSVLKLTIRTADMKTFKAPLWSNPVHKEAKTFVNILFWFGNTLK